MALAGTFTSWAQNKIEGTCGVDCKWSFDGLTLTVSNASKKGLTVEMEDYDMKRNLAPWMKRKLPVKNVIIGIGVTRIGSCAFAGCTTLQEVQFEDRSLVSIAWGAFLNCIHLRTISLPASVRSIETIAFANCTALSSVKIPNQCRVGEKAYASCRGLNSVEVASTAILDHNVFVSEVNVNGRLSHTMYNGVVRSIPPYINSNNCERYGFSKGCIQNLVSNRASNIDYDRFTSDVDSLIPVTSFARNDTYALIIGNQHYRFATEVPYAIHDARIFGEYCKLTLGIPTENIHICEDATKHIILDDELEDWLSEIKDRHEKVLIVYYAGHGVPDMHNNNKAFLLPTDVHASKPGRGIALDDFYGKLGELAFAQTSVFLDACFSGMSRTDEGVSEGLRGVGIEPEETNIGEGNMVVFSAAQGNEPAQGYPEMGHGLFTYFLLKEMNVSKGMISYGDLSERLSKNVNATASNLKLKQKQTPTTQATGTLTGIWQELGF